MRLDTPTLFLMTVVVTYMVGVLFLLSWNQARGTRSLAIWGVAHLVGGTASSLLCLRGHIPDALSIGLANALMIGAYGLIWSGVRAFEGRPLVLPAALAAGALWVVACLVPAFYASLPARVILASTMAGLFCTLGAREIWRGRAEPLVSRYTALVLLAAYAALYWVRIPFALFAPPVPGRDIMASPWIAILCFGGVLFTVALAFTFMALTKERAEREQRLAAETDPLTGIANRRAFVGRAGAVLHDPARPAALLLFDLDHFKGINDGHGHAVSDAVLVGFCHLVGALLPRGALFGRMGGEEFACLLPDHDADAATGVAELIRAAARRITVEAFPALTVSVSVGVAAAARSDPEFDPLLRRADAALYRAKHAGRNCVAVAPAAEPRAHAA